MTPHEIAAITGGRIRDGEPQTVPSGTECDSGRQPPTGSTLPWDR
jgi:hypothetical protein